ncbi:MAG: carbonic anhydrase [Candidatus Spechtbacterales bacterium]
MHTVKVPNELLNAHECEALALTCMDFRFREATQQFVREGLGIKQFDGPISIPGACKGLADADSVVYEFAKFAIGTAIRVHHIKKVVIIHHAECGAYGIPNPEEEFQKETEDEKKGDAILGDLFPDLSFQMFFAKRGDGEIIYLPVE